MLYDNQNTLGGSEWLYVHINIREAYHKINSAISWNLCSLYEGPSYRIAKVRKCCYHDESAALIRFPIHFEASLQARWTVVVDVAETFKMCVVGIVDHPDRLDFAESLENLLDLLFCWVVRQILNKDCFAAKWWLFCCLLNRFFSCSYLHLQISGAHGDSILRNSFLCFYFTREPDVAIASAPPTVLVTWQLNQSKICHSLLYFSTIFKNLSNLIFVCFVRNATHKYICVSVLCLLLFGFLCFSFHFL